MWFCLPEGTLFIGDGEAWYLEDGIPKNVKRH